MSRIITIAGFAAVVVFGLVLAWYSRRAPDRVAPLGTLLDRVMASRAIRITIIVFWWWLGWHFFAAAPLPASS
ncbi:hypothetical protein HII28_06285 [Planctomonas sp. JC2975]|uniref:DUF6186 family protein n=1 Tax=Planctomonas sp. JC2975 TaxID=2729626 RepID=UPI0014739DD1|nr:DUF6186 family protein [Planctomonas sp. JC2975]NNC11487.1 hypothetical protein [Planctomonas sp. JC2975]